MMYYNIREYYDLVRQVRSGVAYSPYSGESRRGKWRAAYPFMLEFDPHDVDPTVSAGVRTIARQEMNLILYGIHPRDAALYEDDAELEEYYVAASFQSTVLFDCAQSRNKVMLIPGGCISLIQRIELDIIIPTFALYVYQRSHDLYHAGYSDLLTLVMIADEIGKHSQSRCSRITWVNAHPHWYLDTAIARR